MSESHDGNPDDNGDGDCSQRFGIPVGQPVKAGDTDEYTEAFAERQIVGKSHQRRSS